MGTQDYKIKVEYGVSAVVLLIGVFFIFQAFTIETSREAVGPRTMPLFLAIALVLGGLWLAIRAFTGRAGDLKDGYGFLESDIRRIIMVVGCGILFVFMFWGFGYFAAIIATYLAMLYTFGVRSWVWMLGGGLVLAVIFQWLFMGIMLLNDPAGAIVNLRPLTNWISGA
ncbi:MAG: tripartite tricarboxylate transporter TctB family protein [Candidatus Puniceispirillaceae bacterium]